MDLDLHGTDGRLRAGYQSAATFGPWRLETIGPSLYRVEGFQAHVNQAWLGYRPLTIAVRVSASGPWMEWAVENPEAIDLTGDRLRIVIAGDFTFRAATGG